MQELLEKARKELLDFSLRNKLISYKNSARYTIEITDERSKDIFNILVVQSKGMTFQPAPEKENDSEQDEFSFSQPEEKVQNESRFTDSILETTHTDTQLQKRLRSISTMAKTSIEEQGVNMLFLALGFLKWFESEDSDKARFAPLILLPVKLERGSVRSKFRLRYNEEDVGVNISLLEKLKAEHGINLPIPTIEDMEDVTAFYEYVSKEVSVLPRWEVVENDIRLGFFSFAKFLMYNDLKSDNWPEDQLPHDHPLLSKLLGSGFSYDKSAVNRSYGDDVAYEELYHVLPSDSSQQDVVLAIRDGISVVVQGPPGTGKSQTITNIISDFVARGKKVLFVAEKMAALNVVKNRLDSLQIGDLALEIHSHKSKKKEVLQNLQKTLALTQPKPPFNENEILSDAEHVRSIINNYARAVNTEVLGTGYTAIQAFGHILRSAEKIGEENIPKLDIDQVEIADKDAYLKRREIVRDIKLALERTGNKHEHPFYGIDALDFDFYDSKKWTDEAEEILHELYSFKPTLEKVLVKWGDFQAEASLSDVQMLEKAIIALVNKPSELQVDYESVQVDSPQKIEKLLNVLQDFQKVKERFDTWKDRCFDQTWEQNVLTLRAPIQQYQGKWYRKFFPSYRNAINQVKSWVKDSTFSESEALALVDMILAYQEANNSWQRYAESFVAIFEPCSSFKDIRAEWKTALVWLLEVQKLIKISLFYKPLLNLAPAKQDDLSELKAISVKFTSIIDKLKSHAQLAKYKGATKIEFSTLIDEYIKLYSKWAEHKDQLQDYIQLLKNISRLNDEKLSWLHSYLEEWEQANSHIEDLFNYAWFTVIARRAFKEHEILNRFEGENHHNTVKKFMDLEDQILKLNAYRLVIRHWEGLPNHSGVSVGKLGLLKAEFAKKRKQLPIRRLLEDCGEVIQDIKPVFMMSPMSIAQYLPQGGIEFDLVLFDEASQIKPVEAFGAVLRGKQVVVVGDNKQLPPTSFFDSISDDTFEEEQEDTLISTGDVESILTLFAAKQAPEKMLRWHYRSKHESLITVNNHEFYNSSLFVFPTAFQEDPKRGLQLKYLPNTVYEAGKGGRKNRGEAEEVVKSIIEHVKQHPNLSLGIAAFSQSQARLIEDVLEKTLIDNDLSDVEHFINSMHADEPFFIKNLENVQGDERDVIFISVGYGKQQSGKLSMNFGPINKEGGERRLNVLFSRAKQQCVVFSNLKADDIDLSRTNSVGVSALKQFLQYAHTRELNIPEVGSGFAESPFEQQVAEVLTRNGYDIAHQVGTAGFRIDIGVKHPEQKGRFILAVECDGAAYHSSQIARDRDKTRQLVLEGQGWVFHRIWSTDWFHNQKREAERLLAAVKHFSRRVQENESSSEVTKAKQKKEEGIQREEVSEENIQSLAASTNQYELSKLELHLADELHEYAPSQFSDWIVEVVLTEQPVHQDVVLNRIVKAAGLSRTGNRIRKSFQDGIKHSLSYGLIKAAHSFLYIDESKIRVRDRSGLERTDRKNEYLPPMEIQMAILDVLEKSYGSTEKEILQAIPEYFGIARRTDELNKIINSNLQLLLNERRIQLKNMVYRLL